jgi:hypothetical protein
LHCHPERRENISSFVEENVQCSMFNDQRLEQ